MLLHLFIQLVLTANLADLLKKNHNPNYNMTLIKQKERTLIINAFVLGVSFGTLAVWLVLLIKGGESVLIVIAGILISLGLMQQVISVALDTVTISLSGFVSSWNSVLYLLAKQKSGKQEWKLLQDETEEFFVFPQIVYFLPSKIRQEPSTDMITRHIDERRWELAYPQTILHHDEKSLLSFAKYAVTFLRGRLDTYNRLSAIQQRTGTVNPIVFVAVGTLIWLLS